MVSRVFGTEARRSVHLGGGAKIQRGRSNIAVKEATTTNRTTRCSYTQREGRRERLGCGFKASCLAVLWPATHSQFPGLQMYDRKIAIVPYPRSTAPSGNADGFCQGCIIPGSRAARFEMFRITPSCARLPLPLGTSCHVLRRICIPC